MDNISHLSQLTYIFPIGKTESWVTSNSYLQLAHRQGIEIGFHIRAIRQGILARKTTATTAQQAIDIYGLLQLVSHLIGYLVQSTTIR